MLTGYYLPPLPAYAKLNPFPINVRLQMLSSPHSPSHSTSPIQRGKAAYDAVLGLCAEINERLFNESSPIQHLHFLQVEAAGGKSTALLKQKLNFITSHLEQFRQDPSADEQNDSFNHYYWLHKGGNLMSFAQVRITKLLQDVLEHPAFIAAYEQPLTPTPAHQLKTKAKNIFSTHSVEFEQAYEEQCKRLTEKEQPRVDLLRAISLIHNGLNNSLVTQRSWMDIQIESGNASPEIAKTEVLGYSRHIEKLSTPLPSIEKQLPELSDDEFRKKYNQSMHYVVSHTQAMLEKEYKRLHNNYLTAQEKCIETPSWRDFERQLHTIDATITETRSLLALVQQSIKGGMDNTQSHWQSR
jgi:hypothetical protein